MKPDRGPNVCSAFFPDPLNVDLIQLEARACASVPHSAAVT